MYDDISRCFLSTLCLPFSCMSFQPPTGSSASPGQRTAAWKMAESEPKRQVQKRTKRPRIDIDEQIEEANRLATLLKKVQQSAKNIKKSGQRTKKRLLAKAGRLSGEDLERISVIKRCGLIVDPHVADSEIGGSEDRPSMKASKDTTRGTITDHLVRIFDGIVTAGRPAVNLVPPASGLQTEGLAPPTDSAPTVPGVLRLASKARVGSAWTDTSKIVVENNGVVVCGLNVDQVDGHEVDAAFEKDLDSVADESPEMCNP
jgi:hypothetical protein